MSEVNTGEVCRPGTYRRHKSQKSVDQVKPQDVDFSYFDSGLQMSVLSSEIRITYHRHYRFLWRQDKLQISKILDSRFHTMVFFYML
jgi:hypothetical protein